MRSNRSRMSLVALLWLVGGSLLTLGMTLCHGRSRWERENVVTTWGVYEGGGYTGHINNYVYADEWGGIHSQGFPLWGAPADGPFAVQYIRSDPGNGWIKRKCPSAPLLLLYGVNVVSVVMLLGGTWLALREWAPSDLGNVRSDGLTAELQHSSGPKSTEVWPQPGQWQRGRISRPPGSAARRVAGL